MPRYSPVFINRVNQQVIPKYGPALISEEQFTPPQNAEFFDMDEIGVANLATPALWTNGVGSCHVICMYGYTNNHLTHMGMNHVPAEINDGVAHLLHDLDAVGCDQITTYIIGGQPISTDIYVPQIMDIDIVRNFSIAAVIAPLTTNGGGSAAVMMEPNRIRFYIEDNIGDGPNYRGKGLNVNPRFDKTAPDANNNTKWIN